MKLPKALCARADGLTREHWEGVTLAELVRGATATFGSNTDRVAATGPEIQLTPKAAVAIAMALHELGTNAAKYGALSNKKGHIDLDWKTTRDGFNLEWHERGGPPVFEPRSHGFAMRMIERALTSDLTGKVDVTFATSGVRCRIKAIGKGNIA